MYVLFIFMTNDLPSGTKKHRKCIEPDSRQTAKILIFFSFFFFFFHDGFHTKQQHFTLCSALAHYIFFTCMHATNHLATKVIITQDR